MFSRIAQLARRVQDDPFFLASVLANYARTEQLDEAGLAAALGCSIETLSQLRLCRRPRPDSAFFRHDIDRIATRFGIDSGMLAEAVRRSDALSEMLRRGQTDGGLLAAARDRPEDDPENEASEGRFP